MNLHCRQNSINSSLLCANGSKACKHIVFYQAVGITNPAISSNSAVGSFWIALKGGNKSVTNS